MMGAAGGRDGAMMVWDFRAGERQVRDLHDSWAVAPVISVQVGSSPSSDHHLAVISVQVGSSHSSDDHLAVISVQVGSSPSSDDHLAVS